MNKKDLYTLIGFILFIIGFVSVTLSLVGIRLSFLTWLDKIGPVFSFVAKIVMILTGLILVVVVQGGKYEQGDREP